MVVNLSSRVNAFLLWHCLKLYIFEIFRLLTIVIVARTLLKSNYVKERLVLTTIQDQSPRGWQSNFLVVKLSSNKIEIFQIFFLIFLLEFRRFTDQKLSPQ